MWRNVTMPWASMAYAPLLRYRSCSPSEARCGKEEATDADGEGILDTLLAELADLGKHAGIKEGGQAQFANSELSIEISRWVRNKRHVGRKREL
jgi:hypothetical protein